MYIVRKYHQQNGRFICSGSREAFFLSFALLALALAAWGALFFYMGVPAMNCGLGIPHSSWKGLGGLPTDRRRTATFTVISVFCPSTSPGWE